MCGLFGWAGTSPENFNYTKLKLMGLLNDERGGDGFGLYNGIEVYKSVVPGRLKDGLRSQENLHKVVPQEFPIFMGHTRKKSTGRIDMEHTQPILWDVDGLRSCVMHNGTIDSLDSLLTSLSMRSLFKDIFGFSDTQIVSRIIHQLKVERRSLSEVLNIYSGTAAFLIYFDSEPNGFYIFRGGSKWYDTSVNPVEERPLYYSVEKDKGVYVSSIEDSLSYIVDGTDFTKPIEVPLNKLLRVEGASITEVEDIDRDKISRYGNYSSGSYKKPNYDYDDDYGSCCRNTEKPIAGSEKFSPNINLETIQNKEGMSVRKHPTFEYLTTYFTNFYALGADRFRGNHIETLLYISELYPSTSLIKFSPKNISLSDYKGSKIVFYKGRYVITSSTDSKNAWGVLANGVYYVKPDGEINYGTSISGEKRVGFKHGVRVSLEDAEFTAKILGTLNTHPEYSTALLKFEYNTFLGLNSPIYKHLAEPVALFYPGGKMYTPSTDRENMLLFSGRYEPLFGKLGYNVQNGIVTSSYVISKRSQDVQTTATKIYLSTKTSKVLTLCPECYGETVLCEVCGGDGYMDEELANRYKKLANNEDEDLINQSIADEGQALSVIIRTARLNIEQTGEETEFSKKMLDLLDTFDKNLIEIMSYG